jgi:hypothetical protein
LSRHSLLGYEILPAAAHTLQLVDVVSKIQSVWHRSHTQPNCKIHCIFAFCALATSGCACALVQFSGYRHAARASFRVRLQTLCFMVSSAQFRSQRPQVNKSILLENLSIKGSCPKSPARSV